MPAWAVQLIEAVVTALISAGATQATTGNNKASGFAGLIAGIAKLLPKQILGGANAKQG